MIRTLEPSSDRLKITVLDEPGKGGETHQYSCLYQITNMDGSQNVAWDGTNQHSVTLMMQNGPLSAGKPANGLTEEVLLAIVIDRLKSMQFGQDGHFYAATRSHCETALKVLNQRSLEAAQA